METLKVILKPVTTEKGFIDAGKGEYSFVVDKNASKPEIAKAIKKMFDVDVVRVKTTITKSRSRRNLKGRGRAAVGPIKKATVKLAKEQKIDIFEVAKE